MDHPADSIAKLCQGGKGRYVGREGIPMDYNSGKECELGLNLVFNENLKLNPNLTTNHCF